MNTPHSDFLEQAHGELASFPPVAIILLNWNGWRDTIECLESLYRLSYPAFTVLVCDNASTDGSLGRIQAWARGELEAGCSSHELDRLVRPPVPKPLPFAIIDGREPSGVDCEDARLLLIQTGANLGFAGGNNFGLRLALARRELRYFWVLNNDTVVESDALSVLIEAMERDRQLGLCGAVLKDYATPDAVLTMGGRKYNRWTGRSRPVRTAPGAEARKPAPIDYVEGASMLVRREFLDTVGLMAEDYFLYFEEIDWALRTRGRFRLSYAPGSVVYHKEGASIGSHRNRRERSTLSDFFQARNRLTFTRRFYPWLLPAMLLSVAMTAVHRFIIGRRRNAAAVMKGMLAAWDLGGATVA